MKTTITTINMYRKFDDTISNDEATTVSYLMACGILEMYMNSGCAEVTNVEVHEETDAETEDSKSDS